MTIVDTGPLVALLDRRDQHHQACKDAVLRLPGGQLVTTWPCFTEAMYFLDRVGGYPYKAALWQLHVSGRLTIHNPSATEVDRMVLLMEKYQDAPMDLADASLVALAESRSARQVFTTDSHFRIYRLPDGSVLDMIP